MNKILTLTLFVFLLSQSAQAKHFNFGIASKADTIDPHLTHNGANWTLHSNIYQTLTEHRERKNHLTDPLDITHISKTSNGIVDHIEQLNNKLIIRILPNIKFHDGTLLTSDDVIYSIERIRSLGKKSGYISLVLPIQEVKKLTPHQFEIKYQGSLTSILDNIRDIYIIKKDSANKPIGSGDYIIASHSENFDRIDLKSFSESVNKNAINSASYIYIKKREERLQQFLDGKLDALEKITPKEKQTINQLGDYSFTSIPSSRLIYLSMDQIRDQSPFIKNTNNQAAHENPFKHLNVRRALSLAIDRTAIIKNILDGGATEASQFLSPVNSKYLKAIKPDVYNPDLAKKLLAEAGYAKGFKVSLHTPNNRYLKDESVAQSIANMLSKVNIDTQLISLDKKTFFNGLNQFKHSFSLSGWAGLDPFYNLKNLIFTYNKETQFGLYNTRYSNKKIDQIILSAHQSSSVAERTALTKQAMLMAIQDQAIIPLYFEQKIWVVKKPYYMDASHHSFSYLRTILVQD